MAKTIRSSVISDGKEQNSLPGSKEPSSFAEASTFAEASVDKPEDGKAFQMIKQKAAAMVCRGGFQLSYPSRSTLPPTPSFFAAANCLKVLPRRLWLIRRMSSAAPSALWGGGMGPEGAAMLRSSILGLRSIPDTRPGICASRKR